MLQWEFDTKRVCRKSAIIPQLAKQVWRPALERHGDFSEELTKIIKLESVHGAEFTWETAHSHVLYEVTWRDKLAILQHLHEAVHTQTLPCPPKPTAKKQNPKN